MVGDRKVEEIASMFIRVNKHVVYHIDNCIARNKICGVSKSSDVHSDTSNKMKFVDVDLLIS